MAKTPIFVRFESMIVFLEGTLVVKTPAYVWLQVGGLAYEVHISLNTYTQIQSFTEVRLFTYLQVKEDAHTLYGFADETERNLFLQLISVSGIGATTARMMLSGMKPEELIQAIRHENEIMLGKIKGIGPKTAKRLILELKDKLMKLPGAEQIAPSIHNNLENDALQALISLGIARSAALSAIQKTLAHQDGQNLEEVIKSALKNL